MIEFEVKSKTQPIGKRKGQTVYFAQPVSQQHLTNKMVVDRIVRESSLSAGDVSNALISLGAIVRDAFEFEERNNIWNTPYLFNAKEFDEETGLYYYGARYYDPKICLWVSTDLKQEYFPNNSSYAYCCNNPIILIDPEGNSPTVITGIIGAGIGGIIGGGFEVASQLLKNGKVSNWKAVGGSALQGAITGGVAGLTGGASLVTTAAATGTANAVGGVANRAIRGQHSTARDVLTDATVGTIFGAGGKIIGAGLSSLTSSVSKQATSKLTQLASKVIANMGAGKGPVYGTKVHSAFGKIANGMKIGN